MKLLVKNVVTIENNEEKSVSVLVNNGKIVEINESIPEDDCNQIIDGEGNYILPGLIDLNCEICDPGYDYKDDMMSISKAAIKSGFTSITASPNTYPIIDNKVVAKYISYSAAEKSAVNIYPYGHMTKNGDGEHISEIGEMINGGIVGISDGNDSISNNYILRNIFAYSKMFKVPIITFCDDKALRNEGMIHNGKASIYTGLKGVPTSAEDTQVGRNLLLAKERNAKLHITKITTSGSVELIRLAKKYDVNVTCDTSPHYFYFTEENVLNYDTRYKVYPPLRSDEDVNEILLGLMDGTIDTISSGHNPENEETKKRGFENASFGISSIETTFLASYNKLVIEHKFPLKSLVDKLSLNGYNLLNIKNKGKIQVGYDADFFLFDKNKDTFIKAKDFESKAKYSLFDEFNFKGSVEKTFINGELVYSKEL